MEATADRVTGYLSDLSRRFPFIWEQVEALRSRRGKDLPQWPDWCYLPLAGAYVIANQGRGVLPAGNDVAVIGALSTWHATQGIYRIDRDVFDAVWDTPVETLPVEVFYQLPEWCLYVEIPAPPSGCGFFAHLEWDADDGSSKLRLLFDNAGELLPVVLRLTRTTVSECLAEALQEAGSHDRFHYPAPGATERSVGNARWEVRWLIERCIILLLYISAAARRGDLTDEDGSARQPTSPESKKEERARGSFAPDHPTIWRVGWRMGAALRAAQRAHEEIADLAEPPASAKPHIRRAHFHHYWTRPRTGNHGLVLKWLAPIPVKFQLGQILPIVRRVQ